MSEPFACTAIPVRDLDKCSTFLREKLGFSMVRTAENWTQLSAQGAQVVLFKQMNSGPIHAAQGARLALGVEKLEETYRTLCDLSVPFKHPPEPMPFGQCATAVDPEGNEIDLVQWTDSPAGGVISSESVVNDILARNPEAMEVLEDHGIRICGGCIVLLNGTVQETAEYSGLLPAEASELVEELNDKVHAHGAAA